MEANWIGTIIVRELEALKREIGAYPDDESVWRAVPGIANTSGTLALHLAGNIRHFIGAELGGSGYVRDRDAEFARRGVGRAELIAGIDEAITVTRATLGGSRAIDLAGPLPGPIGAKFGFAIGDWLVHLVSHLGYHLGQVDYHRRVVTGQPTSVEALPMAVMATAKKS